MFTAITEGVKVTVETEFQPEYSRPHDLHYMFTYRVTIENRSDYTVQLLRRRWQIFDSNAEYREIEGDGVVGQQPVIEPGEAHQYVSGCNLRTGMGKMKGVYMMERMIDGRQFEVEIPEFHLIVPFKLN